MSRDIFSLKSWFLAMAAIALAAPSAAQQPAAIRVHGRIVSVAGDHLVVTSSDGKNFDIVLAPDAAITAVVPARLEDIEAGQFVGTAAEPEGAGLKALEVHIFAPGTRPGEGHRPWDPQPGATMTNADVTAAVAQAGNRELTLTTGGHDYKIAVPPETPIVKMSPGSRALIVVGSFATINQAVPDNAGFIAKAITVGKDGRWPPK